MIIDLHAAPGGQTGVNHDDGPGVPLTFYVPKYRRLTIALWREIESEQETAYLLKSAAMKQRLLEAKDRQGGLPIEEARAKLQAAQPAGAAPANPAAK